MSDSHADDFKKHVKIYFAVFSALAILTVVTVAAAHIEFAVAIAVSIGLLIAIVKGSLVALFFMHLSNERRLIYSTLILTAVFFFVLILLPLLALMDGNGANQTHLYVP